MLLYWNTPLGLRLFWFFYFVGLRGVVMNKAGWGLLSDILELIVLKFDSIMTVSQERLTGTPGFGFYLRFST